MWRIFSCIYFVFSRKNWFDIDVKFVLGRTSLLYWQVLKAQLSHKRFKSIVVANVASSWHTSSISSSPTTTATWTRCGLRWASTSGRSTGSTSCPTTPGWPGRGCRRRRRQSRSPRCRRRSWRDSTGRSWRRYSKKCLEQFFFGFFLKKNFYFSGTATFWQLFWKLDSFVSHSHLLDNTHQQRFPDFFLKKTFFLLRSPTTSTCCCQAGPPSWSFASSRYCRTRSRRRWSPGATGSPCPRWFRY